MNKKKLKPIPRCEREGKRERMFSTNFAENLESSGIKCWVPWEDFLSIRTRYEKLVKRRRREVSNFTIDCCR